MYKAVLIGFVLDLFFGDPVWLPHPICFIGKLIAKMEKIIRRNKERSSRIEFFQGGILVITVMIICFFIPWVILWGIRQFSAMAALIIESFFCYQIFATKSLKVESMKVRDALKKGMEEGRTAVSMIVGRDTKNLTREGVIKACVETIAENTTDGVIAPMLFMLIGGAPLGFLYKSINTMDSMIGYKNDKYLYFGKIGARVDDAANFIPARITAIIMIFSTVMTKYNTKSAIKIFIRDRKNHKSPNAAQTESVMAGALNVQLAGDAFYFGEKYEKPTIGDKVREIQEEDIKRANNILYRTAVIAMMILGVCCFIIEKGI